MRCFRINDSPSRWLQLLRLTPLLGFKTIQARCQDEIAVQVLGSGGLIANSLRASSSYVVWIAGESRLFVDTGVGTHPPLR